MNESCPRMSSLSGYVDGALPREERVAFEAHLHACPVCGAALAELDALRATFRALPDARLPYDMAELIVSRLPAEAPDRVWRERRSVRRLAPLTLGAAAALAGGIYLGGLLVGAASVASAPPVAALAVFDAVPPGALCTGDPACYGGAK